MSRSSCIREPRLITFTSQLDSGNGLVESMKLENNTLKVDFHLEKEPFTEGTDKRQHNQWFHFKLGNVADTPCEMTLTKIDETSYASTWSGYWAVASSDLKTWTRIPTKLDKVNNRLIMTTTPSAPTLYVAYFAPFTYSDHQALIARCQQARDLDNSPLATVTTIAQSLDGRDVEMVQVGNGPAKVWMIARQHPGESMAEHYMQGLLERLLDPTDAGARTLRQHATLRLVPNMNPDGTFRGHLRTNACGANLNREWGSTGDYEAPTLARSPEVYMVREKIRETGCDAFVDVHGDEGLPHIFFAGTQGIPNWSDRLMELLRVFSHAQLDASPEFQLKHGYGNQHIGKANLAICGDAIAQEFDCLAVTLEMPFKDVTRLPEPIQGWSPARCQGFGATMVDALLEVAPLLRADFPFGNGGLGSGLDEKDLSETFKHGYENPPSTDLWSTEM